MGSHHEENTQHCVLDSLVVSDCPVPFPMVHDPVLYCIFIFLTLLNPCGFALILPLDQNYGCQNEQRSPSQ